jgi:DNA adenine methylase
MKPFISYVGTKSRFMKALDHLFPKEIVNYYEPFVGGGSVFLYLNTVKTIKKNFINDIDKDVVTAYKCLKTSSATVLDMLQKLNEKRNKRKNTFYKIVDSFNNERMNDCMKTSVLIYLSKMAYNSKLNYLDGVIKPSYSIAYATSNIYDETNIKNVSNLLQNTKICCTDFKTFLNETKPRHGDFVFFDPPYLVDNVYQYYKDVFSLADFVDLKNVCDKLDQNGVKWMITVNKHPKLSNLFKKYHQTVIKKHSNISCGTYVENELIIRNYQ